MSELTMQFTEMTAEQFQAHLDQRSVNTHDAAKVATWFAEDGVQRVVANGTTWRGRDAIRQNMAEFFRMFPDVHIEVRDLFAAGDRLCVEVTVRGTHEGEMDGVPPTGRRIEVNWVLVFRVGEDGLVKEETVYGDNATMLRQLGVLPEMPA